MTELSYDYSLRGKCKELSDQAVADDPSLRLVRGWYHCPFWGKQDHWWTVRPDGSIHDPTAAQFPGKGTLGEYEEFTGTCECANCGTEFQETDPNASFESRYAFCSYRCHGMFVGVL